MKARAKVLVFAEWYAPGYKAGGPITSVVNFVSHLYNHLDIYVFTTDRDLGDRMPYNGIETNKWVNTGGFRLFYAQPGLLGWQGVKKVIKEVEPDVIYLNSMFSFHFTIIPLMVCKLGRYEHNIVLSPRGMLRSSALAQKSLKKKVFLTFMSACRVMKNVNFHATDHQEMSDIKKVFGNLDINVIGNLPGKLEAFIAPPQKERGTVKLVFVGRLHPIKNLFYLLQCLRKVTCKVELVIVGPVESASYWESCKQVITELSEKVSVSHMSDISQAEIVGIVRSAHAFVLPTSGENFGHAIFEALSAGRPVLISDQTPWKGLEAYNAGWDLSLSDQDKFVSCIEKLGAMDETEIMLWCKGAWKYCENYLGSSKDLEKYLALFGKINKRVN